MICMRRLFIIALALLSSPAALAQTRCADGTYVSGGCVLTPSGRYIGGGITTNNPEVTRPPRDRAAQQRLDERDARQQNNDVERNDEREGLNKPNKL